MKRERYLAAGVAGLCVLALVALLVVPGAIAEETEPSSYLSITEVGVDPVEASGNAATFSFPVAVSHGGGPAENVTARVRAIDDASGLIAAETTIAIDNVTGDRERTARPTLTVERSGDYTVTVVLYENGQRVGRESTQLRNVEGLSPSPIAFKRFDSGVQTIETSIGSTGGDRTSFDVGVRLWNTGTESAGDVSVELVARQSDSNVVADRTTVTVDTIDSGVAVRPTGRLEVPSGYAYRIDAIISHEGVVVSSATSVVDLDPERELSNDTTFEDVEFEAEEFVRDGGTDGSDEMIEETSTEEGPGFGVLAALAALLATAVAMRLRGDNR
ncbi:DUF7490 domain-containing protein [Halococcoides cellulosivorans]|uniref:DUF7490 domain-containing protein n=1 Tax=Halococcoides cellulosivorans TaxID=1679096 RepID=A0A2R4WYM2_9EURY|nr:PGF-CTERM sorting domain-containing protein [Halococcoides cellulosivorans]AWB26628.1 hypothetical protein HARCEL1_02330 [Halococcoides cellulosivorans]